MPPPLSIPVGSSQKWQNVAQQTAQHSLQMLEKAGVASNARITVRPPEGHTAFDKMFHDLLVAELVAAGHRVTHNSENPLQLSTKINALLNGTTGNTPEVVVTTQARVGEQILASSTQTYALNAADIRLFQQTPEHKTLKVVSQ
jgi:uncharacterized protein with von Willebrand factor type A (vWA) domain